MASVYPEVADEAISLADAVYMASRALPQLDERTELVSAVYLKDGTQDVWKLGFRYQNEQTGLTELALAEVNALSGAVQQTGIVDKNYFGWHAWALESTLESVLTAERTEPAASIPEEELRAITDQVVRELHGDNHDWVNINFNGAVVITQLDEAADGLTGWLVEYDTRHRYVNEHYVYVDRFGHVRQHGVGARDSRDATPLMLNTMESALGHVVYLERYTPEMLEVLKAQAIKEGAYPWHSVLRETTWLAYEIDDDMLAKICNDLHVRNAEVKTAVLIEHEPVDLWRIGMQTEQGLLLLDAEDGTGKVTAKMEVETLFDPSWTTFILHADLEAHGYKKNMPVEKAAEYTDELLPSGAAPGLRIGELYACYQKLYGPDMLRWTQAQLRDFQAMAVLTRDQDADPGARCLQATEYPDVPQQAISKETAAENAARALELTEYSFGGAVLLGTDGAPVWKVCLLAGDRYYYAQVDCLTGAVGATYARLPVPAYVYPDLTDDAPDEFWFRDIVLEETITAYIN